jgi:hypothetical protein
MARTLLLAVLAVCLAGCNGSSLVPFGGDDAGTPVLSFSGIAAGETLTATRTVQVVITGGNYVHTCQVELDGVVVYEMPASADHYNLQRSIPLQLDISQLAVGTHTLHADLEGGGFYFNQADLSFVVQK